LSTAKQPGIFAIHPAFDRTLGLTATNGRFADGTKVIVSRDRGYNTQTWSFVKIGANYEFESGYHSAKY